MNGQYPLFVPDQNDPRWGNPVTGDPEFSNHIWLVPPFSSEPWVFDPTKRPPRRRATKKPEDKTKLKKVDIEQLRDRSGFVCQPGFEDEVIWVCYETTGLLRELDLKVAKRLFKPYKWIAIRGKNNVKLYNRKVPLIPVRYYRKVSESAKWNTFLTHNLASNILIKDKTPSWEYVEGDPKFIPFDPKIEMTTPVLVEYKFDVEKLIQQPLETAGQEPLFKLLVKTEPKPPTTPKRTVTEPAQSPIPQEPSAVEATPQEAEKPPPRKRRAPAKKSTNPGSKKPKSTPSMPESPSSIVLQGVIPAQPNHETDATNKANVMYLIRKIREHPKFAGTKKNPLAGVPDQIGASSSEEETKKNLLLFAQFADFYLQGELGLRSPPTDLFLDSLFT